ncbi:MAG: pH-response regulator protein palH/rim21 [Chaenotheca gracillima]|nr:MAG: pH-response regulator protein palH/rim21 [Chaenotheca gracillima]
MAWDQLSINKAHLAYIIVGGFTSLFMLVSLFVKERLYIGEATVATICGVIFGPHAANLFDPGTWGNVDQITLECSRIVLVVQCFAVGVELPKAYMERHWRSVVFLLVPVMTFGWLITSLFIWWMIEPLTWLESLCCAACVTATDPVLASSVVGKGKFAKRVPKHLRDLLSAESGCNDGMAFPFIYLALYLISYKPHANEVVYHWLVITVLYECIFGAVYGFLIGYIGRHAIKWAEKHNLVDRESFLVFYFVLALFCAGSGSLLGTDDLLVGFSAGIGFSNDGWFLEKTEESHVSNVIDLLLNLAYFVFFGSIIPWQQYNMPEFGMTPWRLVIIAVFVILFRRIPIMLALKPVIPDIKTWREALFAGHFGPIGVGAIFVAILARAELETDTTEPLAVLPTPGEENYVLVQLIWPITTFLVISSILVHGSSIAVFTLGKHINTLTLTMSYTQANEEGPSWMTRLPRIQSQSRSSMSFRKPDESDSSNEKLPEFPPGTLPPIGMPGNFLRRQQEDEDEGKRSEGLRPPSRRRKWDSGQGPGGPISQSAIAPQRRKGESSTSPSGSDTLKGDGSSAAGEREMAEGRHPVEAYQEGDEMIVEDEEGNVIDEQHDENALTAKEQGEGIMEEIKDDVEHPSHPYKNIRKKLGGWDWGRKKEGEPSTKPQQHKRGPALAYQFGNTIIVEDEDGEVVKKYDIPGPRKESSARKASTAPTDDAPPRQRLGRMGTWVGMGKKEGGADGADEKKPNDDDDRIRFTTGGRRMSKIDFIKQIQQLDPKARCEAVNESDAPIEVKQAARSQLEGAAKPPNTKNDVNEPGGSSKEHSHADTGAEVKKIRSHEDKPSGPEGLALVDSEEREIPYHSVGDDLAKFSGTAADKRRQAAMQAEEDSDDDGTDRVPPNQRNQRSPDGQKGNGEGRPAPGAETAAERRRREAALGVGPAEEDSDSDEEDTPRERPGAVQEPTRIRFADTPSASQRLQWGDNVKKR